MNKKGSWLSLGTPTRANSHLSKFRGPGDSSILGEQTLGSLCLAEHASEEHSFSWSPVATNVCAGAGKEVVEP